MKSRGIRCERCGHLVAAASLAVLTLVGCAEKSNTVAVATVAGNAPTVTVTRVIERPMAGSLVASGLLVPREEAAVTAEVGGYQVDKVLVEEGAEVSAGQELARLDPGLLLARINQAKAGVSQAVALAEQARAEADRVKNFDARGVMSIEQVAAREFQAKTAEAAVAVARAQLEDFLSQERRLVVRAPVAGIVLERMVRPGDVASLSQPMFTLARDSLVELDAEVPEDELAGIALDDKATVSLPSGDSAEGTVRLVSPRIDPLTKLGRVRVSLAPHPQLRVGGYARAVFNRTGKPVAAIEEKAVQWEASGPRLITIDNNNLAHPVLVRTGVRDAGFVALEQGPPVGTRVALGSGVALLEGDRVNTVEPGQAAAAQEQAQ
ncbi:MAG: efflux RND transporter periplasmic adaptor subunit [Gammaproteobacteria bacterium]|nr:efflux RND transporter periplasmic adaptor subunit [Gammaproteobacteria bacterium]